MYYAPEGGSSERLDAPAAMQLGMGETAVLPAIGLVALQPWVTPSVLRTALAAAQAFVAEWRELRAVHASQLANTILSVPLSEVSMSYLV